MRPSAASLQCCSSVPAEHPVDSFYTYHGSLLFWNVPSLLVYHNKNKNTQSHLVLYSAFLRPRFVVTCFMLSGILEGLLTSWLVTSWAVSSKERFKKVKASSGFLAFSNLCSVCRDISKRNRYKPGLLDEIDTFNPLGLLLTSFDIFLLDLSCIFNLKCINNNSAYNTGHLFNRRFPF